MADSPNSPVFADQYRFEPVGNDWDRGRSGYTHLVYDLKEKRLGVIKRAETLSEQATEGLKNEVVALRALQGLGVPEVYDTGQSIYGSKKYFFMVIEYVDGIRVEKKLNSLNVSERAEILTQFFGLLTQSHRRGIVNGDVDLKHLFWRRDKKQLVVIDWGNTRLHIDPAKKTEFAFDLARSAEIIYSLVTTRGHPPATGSIALPDDSELIHDLLPLPVEFRELCKWAPRAPSDGANAPYTALELLEISKRWLAAISGSKPAKTSSPARRLVWLLGIPVLVAILAIFSVTFKIPPFLYPAMATATSLNPVISTPSASTSTTVPSTSSSTPELIETLSPTAPPTELPTQTPTIPAPLAYSSPSLTFNDQLLPMDLRSCWRNDITPPLALIDTEGFYRSFDKGEEDWWIFSVARGRKIDESVQADFSSCLADQSIKAIALNAWVTWIEPKRGDTPGREFGFFLESQPDQKREYTFWIDESETMHLRIRETNAEIQDRQILIGGIQHGISNFGLYNKFLIQVFLEIDNEGSDILYVLESSSNIVNADDINPDKMTRIDVSKTFGSVQKMGLVGRGGLTKVLIWPLAFYTK